MGLCSSYESRKDLCQLHFLLLGADARDPSSKREDLSRQDNRSERQRVNLISSPSTQTSYQVMTIVTN